MRKLIMWNVVTLDGFFEGRTKWDLAFHMSVWGEELEALSLEQLSSMDTLIFGRVTYEGMAAHFAKERGAIADFMNEMPKIVFSKTLQKAEWSNTRVAFDAAGEIAGLKAGPGRDIYVFGSADLCATLSRHRLIDEYRLCLCPIVLGGGTPLFKPSASELKLDLLEARRLKIGGVILRYAPGN